MQIGTQLSTFLQPRSLGLHWIKTQNSPLKCRLLFTSIHGVISQNLHKHSFKNVKFRINKLFRKITNIFTRKPVQKHPSEIGYPHWSTVEMILTEKNRSTQRKSMSQCHSASIKINPTLTGLESNPGLRYDSHQHKMCILQTSIVWKKRTVYNQKYDVCGQLLHRYYENTYCTIRNETGANVIYMCTLTINCYKENSSEIWRSLTGEHLESKLQKCDAE